jgi:hypothetical protein
MAKAGESNRQHSWGHSSLSVLTNHNIKTFINVMCVLGSKAWCPEKVQQGSLARPTGDL